MDRAASGWTEVILYAPGNDLRGIKRALRLSGIEYGSITPNGGGEWEVEVKAGTTKTQVQRALTGSRSRVAHDVGAGTQIQHCFAGEERLLTREGVKTFADTAGTTQMVLTAMPAVGGSGRRADGHWVEAEVRSFGEQRLWAVRMRRNKIERTVYTTDGHRWLVRNGPKRALNIIRTEDLIEGHRLGTLLPRCLIGATTPSPFGIAHGVVFGDGTRSDRRHGSWINLWGDKDAQLLRYFGACRTSPVKTDEGVEGVQVLDLPSTFRDLPSRDESVSYLYGWLAGYFAADGHVSKQGQAVLDSASLDHLQFVQALAVDLGISTYGISERERVGYGDEPSTIYRMQFVNSSLRPNFFLIDEHRERYEARGDAAERLGWTVVGVEETDRVEEVYCAVVPETQSFALEGNLWTMNCCFCGSGSVYARSDGAAQCDFCDSVFTVQLQPTHSGTPGTVEGQPYDPFAEDGIEQDEVVAEEQVVAARHRRLAAAWRESQNTSRGTPPGRVRH